MLPAQIFYRISVPPRIFLNTIRASSTKIDLEKLEEESSTAIEVIDDEIAKREEEIERKRNKSRLSPQHRNMLMEKNPYPEPKFWTHGTLKYNRKIFGRYGFESGVDPSICWPTKQELTDAKEYESIAHPFTIPEMIEDTRKKRIQEEEEKAKRQQQIVERVAKLDGWIKDMQKRVAKKEAEANAARAKRERLVEEVRAHFGYKVDPRDDKFKQLLEKKEKEQRKAAKEERRKLKEKQLMEKILGRAAEKKNESTEISEPDNTNK